MKIRKSQCGKPVISRRCAERQNRKHTNTCAITDHFRWKSGDLVQKRGHTSCEASAPIADDYAGITSAEKAADQTAMVFHKFIWNTERKPCQDFKQHLAAWKNTNTVQQHSVPRCKYKHQTGWLCTKSSGCSNIKSLARLILVCPTFIL